MNFKIFSFFAILLLYVACQGKKENHEGHEHNSSTAETVTDTVKKSIPKEEHATIHDAHITMKYYAPAVRGRVTWGGLVPFDQVWVTGAHRATSFEINKDFTVADKKIPAGKYAIFTIPGRETWTFILNRKWDQHLADEYSEKDDVVRLVLKPQITDQSQERLRYSIADRSKPQADLTIRWEKIAITIPFQIN